MKLKSLLNITLPLLLAFSAISQAHAGQLSEKLLTPKNNRAYLSNSLLI